MARSSSPPDDAIPLDGESSEYRLTHYRVYDENGYTSSFATTPPENATLETVINSIRALFHGTGGTGYDAKDLVVLLGPRIVAVVRAGDDGLPQFTKF